MATSDPESMLLDCYRSYIGDLENVTAIDVFVGGGLTGGGLVLALAGWAVFLWNETTTYGTGGFYTVRELSIVAAAIGIPLFLLGVVLMLVGTDRMTAVALSGVAFCLVAVMLFVVTYPNHWDAPAQFNAPLGVSLYGLGAAALVFATGAAYSCRVTGKLQVSDEAI